MPNKMHNEWAGSSVNCNLVFHDVLCCGIVTLFEFPPLLMTSVGSNNFVLRYLPIYDFRRKRSLDFSVIHGLKDTEDKKCENSNMDTNDGDFFIACLPILRE